MSLETNIYELEKQHRALEHEISEALSHPSIDDVKIVELKRRKLQLKDQMTLLRHKSESVH